MIIFPPNFYFSQSLIKLFTFAFSFSSSFSTRSFLTALFHFASEKKEDGEKGELKTHPNTKVLCTGLELNEYFFFLNIKKKKKQDESPFILAGTWGELTVFQDELSALQNYLNSGYNKRWVPARTPDMRTFHPCRGVGISTSGLVPCC